MNRAGIRSPLARWLLRLGTAAALLAVAIRTALPEGGGDLVATLRSGYVASGATTLLCFLAAFASFGTSFGVGAWRFQQLLAACDVAVRWRTLLRAYVVASFFNLVLPGAILGDVYRFADVRRDAGRGSEVLGLVVLERLLGLSALGATALAGALFAPLDGAKPGVRAALVAAALALATLSLLPLDRRVNAGLSRIVDRLAPRSERLAGAAQRALGAVAGVSRRRSVVVHGLLTSLATQWLPVIAVWLLAIPLEHEVPWPWFVVVVPFVNLASLLPITIGGAGVRELMFITLFGALGMRSEVALTLSLSILATALVWAAIGLLMFARGRDPEPTEGEPTVPFDSAR